MTIEEQKEMNLSIIKSLKELHKHPFAIDEIEKFISEYDKPLNSFKDRDERRKYFRDVISKFILLCHDVDDKQAVNKDAMLSYLRLDKKIFPKIINFTARTALSKDAYFKLNGISVAGSNLDFIILKHRELLDSFFSPNLKLFPKSSQK